MNTTHPSTDARTKPLFARSRRTRPAFQRASFDTDAPRSRRPTPYARDDSTVVQPEVRLAFALARLNDQHTGRSDDHERDVVLPAIARTVVRDDDEALGQVLREVFRGAVRDVGRRAQPERERQAADAER